MDEILITILVTIGCSFLNFIATKIYNYFTGDSKNFIWKNKNIDLKSIRVKDEFEELKKRTRIVVIDDEDNFPSKLFENEGYSIDKWDTVRDYGKLENGFYDIIILDIKGVAQHISEEDGLGVLIDLKKNNSAQIIISYSQHSYDLNKVQFFQLADENIAKPSDFLKIKSIIDNLISTQFKPERYINALNQALIKNNVEEKEIKKINTEIAKSIKINKKPDWSIILKFIEDKTELVKQLISLGNTIIKFFK
jgi:hypothetical protein